MFLGGTFIPILGGPAFNAPLPDGTHIAWNNGGTISQVLTATLQPGAYTLSAWVGDRKDVGFPGYTVALYAGGTLLTSDSSLSPGSGQWLQDILHYNVSSGNPLIGDPLEIRLISNGSQAEFDDVTLDYVPIPGSVLLLGSGLVGIISWRRKRAVL